MSNHSENKDNKPESQPSELPQLPNLHTITSRPTHDSAVAHAQKTSTPSIIFVTSSSNPLCQATQPKVIDLARQHSEVLFYVMELNADTSPMIKFGPWNTPIFVLMKGMLAETVLGADLSKIQKWIGQFEGLQNE